MKLPLIPILSILVIFLAGCESNSLSFQDDGSDVAPALGLDASELQFQSDCQFQLVEASSDSSGPVKQGVLALSDSNFYLITAAGDSNQPNYKITIPIADMESVSKLADQFHLTYKGEVMVFWLREASSSELTQENYETVYQLLASSQVPVVAASDSYSLPLHSWDGNKTTQRGGSYIPGVRLSGAYGAARNSNTRGTQVTGLR